MVEVREVEDLKVDPLNARRDERFEAFDDLARRAHQGAVVAKFVDVAADRIGPGGDLCRVAVGAHDERRGVDDVVGRAAHVTECRPDPAVLQRNEIQSRKSKVELGRVARGQRGGPLRAAAADDDRRMRSLGGFGQRRRTTDAVLAAGVVERRPGRGRPHSGDDLKLLGQPIETFVGVRKGDRVRTMLGSEPSGSDPEFDPSVAHRVDLSHRYRQRSGMTEGR